MRRQEPQAEALCEKEEKLLLYLSLSLFFSLSLSLSLSFSLSLFLSLAVLQLIARIEGKKAVRFFQFMEGARGLRTCHS
jgi:hypothetical protein